MRYLIDHDYHIHTFLSGCSRDPEQNPQRILQYAKDEHLTSICLTDHFWDTGVRNPVGLHVNQGYDHISKHLPLPQTYGIRFMLGCEADMDINLQLGILPETIDKLDFVNISTTHLHLTGYTIAPEDDTTDRRRVLYLARIQKILDLDLPFRKMGIAHITSSHIVRRGGDYLGILAGVTDEQYGDIFAQAARKGLGIELNFDPRGYQGKDRETILRPYRIAMACGCRFYLGSDAHHPDALLRAPAKFAACVDALNLKEEHKFHIPE